MTATIHEPPGPRRRRVRVPDAPGRLVGAADDLTAIATEHEYDRDGIREVAARLRRLAEELRES